MITNNTYYKGEIYIPQAKPSISETAAGLKSEFSIFIDNGEEDCLIKCLGYSMYKDLADNIDANEDSLIKVGSDAKWDELVNGKEYVAKGKTKHWLGLRSKKPINSEYYNKSFLAYYVYFKYMEYQHSSTTTVGEKQHKSANSYNTIPYGKVTRAWNQFVRMVQGDDSGPSFYSKNGLLGVDYYNKNNTVCLYDFIDDMNSEDNRFSSFSKTTFGLMNEFNI